MSPWASSEPYGSPAPSPSPRRAVEGATVVVIAATFITVAASSWPLFAGWLEDARPDTAKPGIARAVRGRGWAVAPPDAKRNHALFGPSELEAPPERLGRHPLDRLPLLDNPHLPSPLPGDDSESIAGTIAKPRTVVQLLDQAGPDGRPVISVGPDETLIVVRELNPWILLAVKRDGRVEFGWTTRSQVSVLR